MRDRYYLEREYLHIGNGILKMSGLDKPRHLCYDKVPCIARDKLNILPDIQRPDFICFNRFWIYGKLLGKMCRHNYQEEATMITMENVCKSYRIAKRNAGFHEAVYEFLKDIYTIPDQIY